MTGLSCNRHLATSVKGTTSKTDTQKEFLKLPASKKPIQYVQFCSSGANMYKVKKEGQKQFFDAIFIAIVTTRALITLKYFETRC